MPLKQEAGNILTKMLEGKNWLQLTSSEAEAD